MAIEIARSFDAKQVNEIIHAAFGFELPQNMFVANGENYCLVGEHGAMLFGLTKPGVYSVLSAVKPNGYGAWAVEFGKETAAWMFANTDATRLWATVTPATRKALVTMKAALDVKVEKASGELTTVSITKEKWSKANAVPA